MKTKVFTFGRFNPPTKGHELLIEGVIQKAKELDADYEIYISQKHNSDDKHLFKEIPNDDPLNWEYKISIIENIFPNLNICKNKEIKTPFRALETIAEAGYEKVIMIVGEDRIEGFRLRMEPYVKLWNIKEFEIISIGIRDPDSTGIEGVSGSKLRQFVHEDKKKEFFNGLSIKLSDNQKQEIFDKIRECM